MPKVALHNLGCSKNQVDGEQMLGHLSECGLEIVTDFREADIIIVNTCAFIQEATQEAICAILEMTVYKKEGRCTTLAVAGCFSQRFREEARSKFPEVDLWLGVTDWPLLLKTALNISGTPSFIRKLSQPIATQYLKIAEGCSHKCSFCAIPSIRGHFVGRPEKDILTEAAWLEEQGVKECILVSQDTSSWGRDQKSSLVRLLESLLTKTKIPWIRLMYLHPELVGNDFLSLMAQENRIVPYLDIPLQHISDDILLSMNRRPLSKGVYELIDRIRSTVPQAAIRTTFIVGYPGETASHFDQLLEFVNYARFERCGVFPFSPEKGTEAYSMKKKPHNTTAARRCDELMALQSTISREICATKIGQTLDVIIDAEIENPEGFSHPCFEGRTKWDAPEVDGTVTITRGEVKIGSILPVRIVSAGDYDLAGEITAV